MLGVAVACESTASVWMGALQWLQPLINSRKWLTWSRCHLGGGSGRPNQWCIRGLHWVQISCGKGGCFCRNATYRENRIL